MTRFCVARSGLPISVISAPQQLEAHLVAIERDRRNGDQCPAHFLVVIERDDSSLDSLIVLGELLLDEPHVAERLADDNIACSTTFEFHHKQALLVLADGKYVDWPRVGRILLANRVRRRLPSDRVRAASLCHPRRRQ
jgi:hypothetical protein